MARIHRDVSHLIAVGVLAVTVTAAAQEPLRVPVSKDVSGAPAPSPPVEVPPIPERQDLGIGQQTSGAMAPAHGQPPPFAMFHAGRPSPVPGMPGWSELRGSPGLQPALPVLPPVLPQQPVAPPAPSGTWFPPAEQGPYAPPPWPSPVMEQRYHPPIPIPPSGAAALQAVLGPHGWQVVHEADGSLLLIPMAFSP